MSLMNLPMELQTEILFDIVMANCGMYAINQVIISDIVPYILANRAALDCWRASRRLILHRVATIKLAETESTRRSWRRAVVLARLRMLVWTAAREELELHESYVFVERAFKAELVYHGLCSVWEYMETRADYWRQYLLR
jgi:hypothetical protein